jgi:hypothetical protein
MNSSHGICVNINLKEPTGFGLSMSLKIRRVLVRSTMIGYDSTGLVWQDSEVVNNE